MSDAPTVRDVRVRRSWPFVEAVEREERRVEPLLSAGVITLLAAACIGLGFWADAVVTILLVVPATLCSCVGITHENGQHSRIRGAEVADAD